MQTKPIYQQPQTLQQSPWQEYKLVVITKQDLQEAFGIAAQDACNPEVLSVREIGSNKELALSIIDTLNTYKVSCVHFQDVISDLIHQQYSI